MSRKHLFVSSDLSTVNDVGNANFVDLGEVFVEIYDPPLWMRDDKVRQVEKPGRRGFWRIEVDCEYDKIQNNCPEGQEQVFRISDDVDVLSRIGELSCEGWTDGIDEGSVWVGIDVKFASTVRSRYVPFREMQ